METPINVRDVVYAVVSADASTGISYSAAPAAIAPAMSFKASRKSSSDTLRGDGEPTSNQTTLGEIEVEMELNAIPLSVQAVLLGHKFTAGTIGTTSTPDKQQECKGDKAPYVGIGVTYDQEDGSVGYRWLYKGRFEEPDESVKQKEDKTTFSTPTLKGTFIMPAAGEIRTKLNFAKEPKTNDYKTLFGLTTHA